jgi:SpoIID/LytB domain protein
MAAPVSAWAADSFNIFGSGYGHGLGLSQYGAFGLAEKGWNERQILTHFYSRTKVERARGPGHLRVGLTQLRERIRVRAVGGAVELHVERPGGPRVGRIPADETWTIRPSQRRYKVLDAAGRVVGRRLWGSRDKHLYATFPSPGSKAAIPEAGHTYNRGFLEFNLYSCGGGCELRLIAVLSPQAYLFGLAEVPSSWPMAALRAQAIAGRSYAFAKVKAYGQRRPGCNCGLYATAADQVYAGWDKEGGYLGNRWVRAVKDTLNQVVTFNGRIVTAFYSSSSGGHTENNENVWGGSPIAYLRGVCDPGDYVQANPSRVWKVSYTADNLTSRLRPYTGAIGTIRGFRDYDRGVSGRIVTVRVVGGSGSAVVTGAELRAGLGLRDDRVWINSNRNVEGVIRDKYDRLGCAPGLPTSPRSDVPGGFRQAFKHGAIYHNRDPSTTVWLRGIVYEKYRKVGAAKGKLGLPVGSTKKLSSPDGCRLNQCSRTRFEGGNIYFRSKLGAHAIRGAVLKFYEGRKKGPDGPLGFPKTDVRSGEDGSRYAVFQGGTVTCSDGSCSVS